MIGWEKEKIRVKIHKLWGTRRIKYFSDCWQHVLLQTGEHRCRRAKNWKNNRRAAVRVLRFRRKQRTSPNCHVSSKLLPHRQLSNRNYISWCWLYKWRVPVQSSVNFPLTHSAEVNVLILPSKALIFNKSTAWHLSIVIYFCLTLK